MSANDDRPGREIAHRLFAAEYDDASLSHAESDRERAPNYVITPTGARINRLFVVGTLTEVSPVNEDMVRARIVDPTGAFVVYAGQYQPEALAALESLEVPAFVAVTGKARTFQPDDSDRVYTSIRPESVATVDADTRDRWVIDAADRTLDRIETYAAAAQRDEDGEALTNALLEAGVDEGLAKGISLARTHYETTPGYLVELRELAIEAVEVVAGERDHVGSFDLRPDEADPSDATFTDLAAPLEDVNATVTAAVSDADSTAVTDASDADETVETGTPDSVESEPPAEPAAESTVAEGGTKDSDESIEAAESDGQIDGDESVPATTTEESMPTTDVEESAPAADAEESAPATDAEEPVPTANAEGSTTEPDQAAETAAADDEPLDPGVAADSSGEAATSADDASEDGLGDFEAGGEMYEMDDEEREQIESEFGAEFSTGTEVDEPGEADIDVPDEPAEDDVAEEVDSAETSSDDEPVETSENDDTEETDDGTSHDGAGEDADVQALVVETMTDLDEGTGADRGAVIEAVVEQAGVSESAVEDAIQDALMGGQCYEPDDETLKAI